MELLTGLLRNPVGYHGEHVWASLREPASASLRQLPVKGGVPEQCGHRLALLTHFNLVPESLS